MEDLSLKIFRESFRLEDKILANCFHQGHVIDYIYDKLKPEDFYKAGNLERYQAIRSLYEKAEPITLISVDSELARMGHPFRAVQVLNNPTLGYNIFQEPSIEHMVKLILEFSLRRKFLNQVRQASSSLLDLSQDVFELLENMAKFTQDSEAVFMGFKPLVSLQEVNNQSIERLRLRMQGKGLEGLSTGFKGLDELTGGWQKSDLIILAARPSMGKTYYASTFARNAAREGANVLLFSLEMNQDQISDRAIVLEHSLEYKTWLYENDLDNQGRIVSNKRYRSSNNLSEELVSQLEQAADLSSYIYEGILVDDSGSLTSAEITGRIRRESRKLAQKNQELNLVLIDYIQLANYEAKGLSNANLNVGAFVKDLKGIAKELNIPVIALSQLNRAVENRADKMPRLSDLRESGEIEQHADVVMFCMRPEYYGIPEIEGVQTNHLSLLKFAKHRNGGLETHFHRMYTPTGAILEEEDFFATPF